MLSAGRLFFIQPSYGLDILLSGKYNRLFSESNEMPKLLHPIPMTGALMTTVCTALAMKDGNTEKACAFALATLSLAAAGLQCLKWEGRYSLFKKKIHDLGVQMTTSIASRFTLECG